MTEKEIRAEKLYQTTMYMARRLLEEGIITSDEYVQIEVHFVSKYDPLFGELFSSLSLTSER